MRRIQLGVRRAARKREVLLGRGTTKPTLKTIARLSGFAVPTVSRALGNAPDISEKTKTHVRRIAHDVDYVPNRAAIRLRTGRTLVISFVISIDDDAMNFTSRLIASCASALRDTPYQLVVTPDDPHGRRIAPIRKIVESQAADAIIINRTLPHDPRVIYMLERGFPFVSHGRTAWASRHAYFDYDNGNLGQSAVVALARRNRRRLLMIAPPRNQTYGQLMVEGALAGARAVGACVDVSSDVTSDDRLETIETMVRAKLNSLSSIDGLICASQNAAIGAIAGIEAEGLRIGDDIDLFSKETFPILKRIRSSIIVEHEDTGTAGAFLARAAVHACSHPSAAPMQHVETLAHVRERGGIHDQSD